MDNRSIIDILRYLDQDKIPSITISERNELASIFRDHGCYHLLSMIGVVDENEVFKNYQYVRNYYGLAREMFEYTSKGAPNFLYPLLL